MELMYKIGKYKIDLLGLGNLIGLEFRRIEIFYGVVIFTGKMPVMWLSAERGNHPAGVSVGEPP